MKTTTQSKATETNNTTTDEESEYGYLTDEQWEIAEEEGYFDD